MRAEQNSRQGSGLIGGLSMGWNIDNFGPIQIPKKGETIKIDSKLYALYEVVLNAEDPNHDVPIMDEIIEHTVQEDWFFVLGENRHNAFDSRYIGFISSKQIVGVAAKE
jgi:signal peptidase I